MDTVHRILTIITRLTRFCLQSLHHRFVAWTKPNTASLLLGTLIDLSRSKSHLVAENALLRKPLIILPRQVKRPACSRTERMLLVLLTSMVRTWNQALFIVEVDDEARGGIARASNALASTSRGLLLPNQGSPRRSSPCFRSWQGTIGVFGAERIRGELLKLGIHVCKRTIEKYVRAVPTTRPPGQTWRTFFHTHAQHIWACDAPACHGSPLPLAVGLLPHRTEVTQSDACRRETLSHRRLDGRTSSGSHLLW
jgi:hypothetical protein